jgi:hypothetical protein
MKHIIAAAALVSASVTTYAGDIQINFESPRDNIYAGIDTVRGWAISSAGINRVELYIDGQFYSLLPQGGLRPDVGNAFPTYPGSANSGFALAFNYASLSIGNPLPDGSTFSTVGSHTATVRVVDNDNAVAEVTNEFGNTHFLTERYITDTDIEGDPNLVNYNSAQFLVNGSSFIASGVVVDGNSYEVLHTWLEEAQQNRPILILLTSEANSLTPQNNQPLSGGKGSIAVLEHFEHLKGVFIKQGIAKQRM